MEPTVDEAIAVLIREAVAHEKEHDSEFCEDTRAALVALVMVNLGLSLRDLGLVAEAFVDAMMDEDNSDEDDNPEPQPDDQWPNTIQ